MESEGWVYFDGCIVCPRCNKFISCDNDIPAMLAAISRHDCYDDPGGGHYLRPPEVSAEGWYWAGPDGNFQKIRCQFGWPVP